MCRKYSFFLFSPLSSLFVLCDIALARKTLLHRPCRRLKEFRLLAGNSRRCRIKLLPFVIKRNGRKASLVAIKTEPRLRFCGLISKESFYRVVTWMKNFYSRPVCVIVIPKYCSFALGNSVNQAFLSGSAPLKTRERIELYFIVAMREHWICRRRL